MLMTYAHYHVGLKLLLRKGEEVLFMRTAHSQSFDLPGGRIDEHEDEVTLMDILAREIREELGSNIRYRIGAPLFTFRRFFPAKGWKIFLIVYDGEYLGDDIEISEEHASYEWLDPRTYEFKQQDFFNEEEYVAFMRHLVPR
jgi:8-oxo-dGTP pyrophosphatase MutT (NUDIX family)